MFSYLLSIQDSATDAVVGFPWERALNVALQLPALAIVVYLVTAFLKFLKEQRETEGERKEALKAFLESQNSRFEEIVNDVKLALRDNNAALRDNAASMGKLGK